LFDGNPAQAEAHDRALQIVAAHKLFVPTFQSRDAIAFNGNNPLVLMGCGSSLAVQDLERIKSSHHLLLEHVPLDVSFRRSFTTQAAIPTWTSSELRQRYKLNHIIGQGGYANVWHATDQSNQQAVVVKIAKEKRCKSSLKEARLLLSLSAERIQPHVVPVLNCVMVGRQVHLVTPWAERGDLFSYVDSHTDQLPEYLVQHLFHGLVAALCFCHQHGIAHNDLKPENVVLRSGHDGTPLTNESPWSPYFPLQVQLIDFGEAQPFDGDTLASALVGSPDYLAPEVLAGRYHPAKADCWSLGATLYLMLTDTMPFMAPTAELTEQRVRSLREPLPPAVARRVSRGCMSVLLGLLRRSVGSRLSSTDLWQHPWVMDYRAAASVVQQAYHTQGLEDCRGMFDTAALPAGLDGVFYLADADKSTAL
jgi:serine/threonine protein kinase